MTTNNHPANGPVSLDRLHQIREILSKAAAQSDGGNLGYAMADAVKVIGEVLERRKAYSAEPIYKWREAFEEDSLWGDCTKYQYDGFAKKTDCEVRILYTTPPAPVVPPEKTDSDYVTDCHGVPSLEDCAHQRGWNECRAAMLNHCEDKSNELK